MPRIPAESSGTLSRLTAAASSKASIRSGTSAIAAVDSNVAFAPRTAAASTSLRAGGLQASNLRMTWVANVRGAGSIGSHVFQRSWGSSANNVVM